MVDMAEKVSDFGSVSLGMEAKEKVDTVREAAEALMEKIDASLLNSREKSIARTKLEECVMWANRGISRQQ